MQTDDFYPHLGFKMTVDVDESTLPLKQSFDVMERAAHLSLARREGVYEDHLLQS